VTIYEKLKSGQITGRAVLPRLTWTLTPGIGLEHYLLRMPFIAVSWRSVAAVVGTVVLLVTAPVRTAPQGVPQSLPQGLEEYLAAEVHLTAGERKALLAGRPLTRLLRSDPSKEVFVFGAIWISAAPAEYVRQVKNIEDFETGNAFRITKKIGDPPTLEDFAALELPQDDVKDLRRCKPGDCDIKLSAKGLQAFRTQVRWGHPMEKSDADGAFRRLALEYVEEYLEGGNARLAVYRDADHPVFVRMSSDR
jgi:hypothetical protein